jgi:hypothetical protein
MDMNAKSIQPKILGMLLFVGLVAAPCLRAQAQDNIANLPAVDDNMVTSDDMHDPPSRVARVSFLDGSVSLQPGGTGDWGAAAKNRPMTVGDKLWVDKDSRAELQAGQVAIHLGSMTALSFLNLDQNITQMRLAEGQVNFRVRELREGETYEVDTPNIAFTVKEAGAFRINVNENGDLSSVTVIRGAGEIASGGQTYPMKAGDRADVTGAEGNVQVSTGAAAEPDALDRWAQERDVAEDNSASSKYVNRDVVGYSDLDDYGTWKEEPEYGHVWVPNNVGPDWAPYSDGYWSYVGPWGWTWVGYEPWGFAPYHYGRWNWFGGYWGWCPGPIYSYPYYGPAFVGFLGVGFGFGWGWGAGFGWFPLGWGEPFHPWYHCGFGYWNRVNIHNTYINNFHGGPGAYRNFNYRYAHSMHAVTTASHNAFVNGERINRGGQHLTEASLRNARVTNNINARPSHSSYFGAANARNNVARPSSNVQNRSVLARTAPAAGAAHENVRTMNSGSLGRNSGSMNARTNSNFSNAPRNMNNNRASELSANRPPSAQPGIRNGGNAGFGGNNSARGGNMNNNRPNNNVQPNSGNNRGGNSPRSWSAQGNTTDSGRAPQGFGNNRPSGSVGNNARSDRPPWVGSGNSGANSRVGNSVNRPQRSYNGGGNRSYTPPSYNNNRSTNRPPSSSYGNRSYSAPSYGNRGYSSSPSYGNRGYSSPSYGNRGYSAPSYGGGNRGSYSAPRSYGGGGGSYHGGGSSGGGYHGGGGGGSSHGGGGGGSHGGGGGGGSHSSGGHH